MFIFEWQWHQLGHMQVSTSLQTDNHSSTPPLSSLQAGCPSCRPTNSVKALKATTKNNEIINISSNGLGKQYWKQCNRNSILTSCCTTDSDRPNRWSHLANNCGSRWRFHNKPRDGFHIAPSPWVHPSPKRHRDWFRSGPILSVFPALIVHSEFKSVHPGFPVAFIF